MLLVFRGISFDDFCISSETEKEEGMNVWASVCKDCVSKHVMPNEMLDDAGYGICGVVGCNNEADYYIGFPDGEFAYSDGKIDSLGNSDVYITRINDECVKLSALEVRILSELIEQLDNIADLYLALENTENPDFDDEDITEHCLGYQEVRLTIQEKDALVGKALNEFSESRRDCGQWNNYAETALLNAYKNEKGDV